MSSCLSLEYPESRSCQDGVQAAYLADDAVRSEERQQCKEENQEKGMLGGQGLGQLPLSPLGDSLGDHVEPTARKGEAGTLPPEPARPWLGLTALCMSPGRAAYAGTAHHSRQPHPGPQSCGQGREGSLEHLLPRAHRVLTHLIFALAKCFLCAGHFLELRTQQ